MQVEMTSDKEVVLDVAPYNNHTLNCTVSHESFANIVNGTLVYLFIKDGVMLLRELSKSISRPGPFIALYTASERLEGMFNHTCNVTLEINERLITSAMNGTIVEVVGKCCAVVVHNLFSSNVHFLM